MAMKALLCVTGVLCAGWAAAADRWEVGGDDTSATLNELQPGLPQEAHDLEMVDRVPDEDWYRIRSVNLRSYEARVFGGGLPWACDDCARVERVDASGSILGFPDSGSVTPGSISLRWVGDGTSVQFLRVRPGAGTPGVASQKYDIQVVDTTFFVPRFNNVGTQRTMLILQCTRSTLGLDGQIEFRDESGGLLLRRLFGMSALGTFVYDTSSEPMLAGRSGSATVVHTGGQDGLAGKAVALDPVTGFSFDTPFVGVAR